MHGLAKENILKLKVEKKSVTTVYIPAGLTLSQVPNLIKGSTTSQNVSRDRPNIDNLAERVSSRNQSVQEGRSYNHDCNTTNGNYITKKTKGVIQEPTTDSYCREVDSVNQQLPPKISTDASWDTDHHSYETEQTTTKITNVNDTSNTRKSVSSKSKSSLTEIQLDHSPDTKETLRDKLFKKLKLNAEKKTSVKKTTLPKTQQLECSCTKCDNFIKCPTWCQNNLTFNDADTPRKKGLPLLKTGAPQKETSIRTISTAQLLLHSNYVPKPVRCLNDTSFDKDIQKVLVSMKCSTPTPMQSYLWPAIQRGLSCISIGAAQTGKTLSYLPAFCGFAMDKYDRYAELAQYNGPLVIILCLDQQQCGSVECLLHSLVANCAIVPVVKNLTETSTLNNSDIIVTTPPILEESVKTGSVSLKRLCHLAIEDAHVLFKNFHKNVKNLLVVMNRIQNARPYNKNVQIVVNSERWTTDLDTVLAKLYLTPVVCFEDFVEAAKYSKVVFRKKKLKAEYKLFYIQDILKKHYMTNRVVVFCSESEICGLAEHLNLGGVECITISKEVTDDQILENENMWCTLKVGRLQVLLCTDELCNKAEGLINAAWIVHYSPPSTLQQMRNRFRCMAQNLHPPSNLETTALRYCFFIMEEASDNDVFNNFFQTLTFSSIKYL